MVDVVAGRATPPFPGAVEPAGRPRSGGPSCSQRITAEGQAAANETRQTMLLPNLLLQPDATDESLYTYIQGKDQDGNPLNLFAINERLLTIFLNGREIVTVMTIGEHPRYLALGFLLNQKLLDPSDRVTDVEHDEELGTIMVHTERAVPVLGESRRRIHTSGCALGTLFGGVMESLEEVRMDPAPRVRTSWLKTLGVKIEAQDTLHNKTGGIHRCVLCREDKPLVYVEDVGRHNAIDTIAGYMHAHDIPPGDKILYTTGRLTSEVVIKTVIMGVPILVSRSGFTALGIQLARQTELTMIGRCRGRHFQALSGLERIVFDAARQERPSRPAQAL